MWNKLLQAIFNFKTKLPIFISNLYRYFSFPSKKIGFFIKQVDKCKLFDTYFIEVKDQIYNYSFLKDFLETGILEMIVDKCNQEGLKNFKCIVIFENKENSIMIVEPLVEIFSTNDPKALIKVATKKFRKTLDLDYYKTKGFEIKTVIIKILPIDHDKKK